MPRQRATSSIIYRAPPTRPTFVRADLRGFDHDAMTVIPGPRTRVLAQGPPVLARTVMVPDGRRDARAQPIRTPRRGPAGPRRLGPRVGREPGEAVDNQNRSMYRLSPYITGCLNCPSCPGRDRGDRGRGGLIPRLGTSVSTG